MLLLGISATFVQSFIEFGQPIFLSEQKHVCKRYTQTYIDRDKFR